jgi:ABC-2 type transport system permease protein
VNRAVALLGKELADLRQNPTIFLPSILVVVLAILLPLFVAVIVPYASGERLSDSSDFEIATEMYSRNPATRTLDPEAAIQAYLFQYFLVMLVLGPITSAMSVAAYSVVGEKQARTLEPLLATPLTTFELLAGKVLGALLPAVALSIVSFAAYLTAAGVFARAGVMGALMGPQSFGTVFLLGPLAAMVALQLAVCVSSRVNDARTAQQLGVLVVLPVAGLFVGQIFGAIELTVPIILIIASGLLVVNTALMWIAVRLFDRETILTRWK